jgi:C_GCAxxG_C_C family probable redox protein
VHGVFDIKTEERDLTEPAAQRARELFESGYYCSESVLLAIAESQGIQSDLIPRIATGFGAGIARTGRTCGALSGAICGLGLVLGRNRPDEPPDKLYAAVQTLLSAFEAKYGSLDCRALIEIDLTTPEGRAEFRAQGKIASCLDYAEEAARLALALLEPEP